LNETLQYGKLASTLELITTLLKWSADSCVSTSFPADYRRANSTSVEVNTAVQTQTAVVCTEEQRQALIAQRERILKAAAQDSHNNHTG